MLTKVRRHVILKGRCLRTFEDPASLLATPVLTIFPLPSNHLLYPTHSFLLSLLPSFIQQTLTLLLRFEEIGWDEV